MKALYICNIKKETEHCRTQCIHGSVHQIDDCSQPELCSIVGKKVRCRKLYKKELKLLENNN